jgi:two-component system nitrate/nitrite response regulator NarL
MLPLSGSRNIHVVLLDPRILMRTALRSLLEQQPHLTVIGDGPPEPPALALVARCQPDLIVLALLPQPTNTLALIPALLDAAAAARLLVIVDPWNIDQAQQAVQRGALGVVWTDQPAPTLLTALSQVASGELWVSRRLTARVLAAQAHIQRTQATNPEAARIATLTAQERAVIALLGAGLPNQQIATQLAIAEVTVRHHLTSIFRKLQVPDRVRLLIYAYRNGLAELPSSPPAAL